MAHCQQPTWPAVRNFSKASSNKRQAASNKRQATSLTASLIQGIG